MPQASGWSGSRAPAAAAANPPHTARSSSPGARRQSPPHTARSSSPGARKPEARKLGGSPPMASGERRRSTHGERSEAPTAAGASSSRSQQQQEPAAFFFLCCCFCGCRLSAAAARAKSTDVMVVVLVVLVGHQRRGLSSLVVYMIMRLPNLMMNTSLSVGAPHSGFPLPKQMSLTSKAMDGAFL